MFKFLGAAMTVNLIWYLFLLCVLGNICPTDSDEAKAMVPSLQVNARVYVCLSFLTFFSFMKVYISAQAEQRGFGDEKLTKMTRDLSRIREFAQNTILQFWFSNCFFAKQMSMLFFTVYFMFKLWPHTAAMRRNVSLKQNLIAGHMVIYLPE